MAARVVAGAVVPSAAEVVVVAGIEVAVEQLDKISKCIIIDHVNSNIISQT